ncbi:MAG: NAD(P)/FAD-dependent oxidoreductase [Deltaproteobacteria bacterium]|nr:NAD(P)/FAD-dependent oxidoreductase [Deltaproteobacteria bacterium]
MKNDFDVIVIGAGFAGLYALYRLRDVQGLSVRVFEAGDGVGGTWYWNRYPGARCDSESFIYSYSFSRELEQEWKWSSKYPEQPEILRYLNHVADRFDLRRDIALSTRVVGAQASEDGRGWSVETSSGERVTAQFLVTAVGCLSAANVPKIPGLEKFQGRWVHTGQWPTEGVDFRAKRVGLVGTGSTGIQATPRIAAEASQLTVFQRTPNYTIPARNAPFTAEQWAEIQATYPEIRKRARDGSAGFPFTLAGERALDFTEEERNRVYEALWQEGGFKFLYASFGDILRDKTANETASAFIRAKIRSIVKNPDTARRLTPTDHPYGSKRPPIDSDYFETFNRENVTLVDLRETPLVGITEKGLRTSAAEYPVDVIVFATGFDAMTGALLRMDLRGLRGLRLADAWEFGPRTYLGLQTAGFPNLFTITGPGSPSVLVNMPVTIEQHVDWIGDCIGHMRSQGLARIEAIPEAQDAWVEHVNEVARGTLFYEAKSWYLGCNIPGKPEVFMPYAGGQPTYRKRCDEVARAGYEGFRLSA